MEKLELWTIRSISCFDEEKSLISQFKEIETISACKMQYIHLFYRKRCIADKKKKIYGNLLKKIIFK